MFDIPSALVALRPGEKWALSGDDYSGLQWMEEDTEPPTLEEIETEIQRQKNQYNLTLYQRQRAAEYPSIVDQLDKLYHDGYDGWKAEIEAIKLKYPRT